MIETEFTNDKYLQMKSIIISPQINPELSPDRPEATYPKPETDGGFGPQGSGPAFSTLASEEAATQMAVKTFAPNMVHAKARIWP